MRTKKLISTLRPLIDSWYVIDSSFNIWIGGRKKNESNIIKLTIEKASTFSVICKALNAEVVGKVVVRDIGWEDSLRFLYHHFPYWPSNSSNCFLMWSDNKIIAIQWNGQKETRTIFARNVAKRPYIIINNKKQVEGNYSKEEGLTLIDNIIKNENT